MKREWWRVFFWIFILFLFMIFYFLNISIYLCIYVLPVLGLQCCVGFSLDAGSRGCCRVTMLHGLLMTVASLVADHRLSSCSPWALEHRLSMWCTGLVALGHVGSPQTRDGTHVSCIGRQILCHWTTREAPLSCSCIHWHWLLWHVSTRRMGNIVSLLLYLQSL